MEIQCSLQIYQTLIAENASGYDTAWIVGDNFASRSYRIGFKKGCDDNTFLKRNFEVKNIINSRYSDKERNVLIRIKETFVSALNKYNKLPKLAVVVLDDDLIDEFNSDQSPSDISPLMGQWFNALVTKFDELITERKNFLPHKAKKPNWPQVFWVTPTYHDKLPYHEV